MESIKIQKKTSALVSTTLLKIYCRKQRRQHIAGVFVTGGQPIASVVDTGDKDIIVNNSVNFCKNLKWPQYDGLDGNLFVKKPEV
jgi:hypothetical protein